MLDLFIVKSISYLGCFRAILSLHEIDLGCLGVLCCLNSINNNYQDLTRPSDSDVNSASGTLSVCYACLLACFVGCF